MTSFVSMRLLRAIVLSLSAMLAASAAMNLALLVAYLYETRLTIHVFGRVLFAQTEMLGGSEVKLYHLCNTIIIIALFVASILTLKVARIAAWSRDSYKKSTFKVLAIVALLSFAELIRALIEILLLRVELSSSDYVGYAAILCLELISFVLIRSVPVVHYYNRLV